MTPKILRHDLLDDTINVADMLLDDYKTLSDFLAEEFSSPWIGLRNLVEVSNGAIGLFENDPFQFSIRQHLILNSRSHFHYWKCYLGNRDASGRENALHHCLMSVKFVEVIPQIAIRVVHGLSFIRPLTEDTDCNANIAIWKFFDCGQIDNRGFDQLRFAMENSDCR